MSQSGGMIIGAGAGPWFHLGTNSELAPNFSWQGTFGDVKNQTWFTKIEKEKGTTVCDRSPSTDCALMMNLFGSRGEAGDVLKVSAKGRKGEEKGFTECIRHALTKHYGKERMVSLGGAFVIKSGKTHYHVMPDFPKKPEGQDYTFKDAKQLNDWLTYHDFSSSEGKEIVCLTVMHSADPEKKLGLRMEHTHCYSVDGSQRGGHYHYDLEGEEVEYEAYFNTAKAVYRIDQPEVSDLGGGSSEEDDVLISSQVTLERDLHD